MECFKEHFGCLYSHCLNVFMKMKGGRDCQVVKLLHIMSSHYYKGISKTSKHYSSSCWEKCDTTVFTIYFFQKHQPKKKLKYIILRICLLANFWKAASISISYDLGFLLIWSCDIAKICNAMIYFDGSSHIGILYPLYRCGGRLSKSMNSWGHWQSLRFWCNKGKSDL